MQFSQIAARISLPASTASKTKFGMALHNQNFKDMQWGFKSKPKLTENTVQTWIKGARTIPFFVARVLFEIPVLAR